MSDEGRRIVDEGAATAYALLTLAMELDEHSDDTLLCEAERALQPLPGETSSAWERRIAALLCAQAAIARGLLLVAARLSDEKPEVVLRRLAMRQVIHTIEGDDQC